MSDLSIPSLGIITKYSIDPNPQACSSSVALKGLEINATVEERTMNDISEQERKNLKRDMREFHA